MKILFNNYSPRLTNYNLNQNKYANIRPLMADTVSFSALKKSKFEGFDLYAVNRFKAPIEKFNSNDDFQNWCQDKLDSEYLSKIDKICKSEDMLAQMQKKVILEEWINHLEAEDSTFTPAIKLIILSSITSNLNYKTKYLPPSLDKNIAAYTLSQTEKKLKKDKSYTFNFDKLYRNNLFTQSIGENEELSKSRTGWAIIPSKKHDSKNFEQNVEKLKILSHNNWCTKSYNAELCLTDGDFHVYFEDGKPKLGIRFDYNEVQEIQGEKNNSKIPVEYIDIAEDYIKRNDSKLSYSAEEEFEKSNEIRDEIENLRATLAKRNLTFETCAAEDLFEAIGIKFQKNNEGKLIIEEYRQPSPNVSYNDLGIDENKIFKDVVEIKKDARFTDSSITNLSNLKKIDGNADFRNSKVSNLDKLEIIQGDADFSDSVVTNLSNLRVIGGDADFKYSEVSDLSNLKIIGGNADFKDSMVTNLDKLQVIGGDADFFMCEDINLDNIEVIQGSANFRYSKIKSLPKLELIGGDTDFTGVSNSKTLFSVEIGGTLYVDNKEILSGIKSAGKICNSNDYSRIAS